MSVRCKDLGVNLSPEAIDFCPTASATISHDARGESAKRDFEMLRAQMRNALRNSHSRTAQAR